MEINEKIDYLFSKINFKESALDAKSIQIMNELKSDIKELKGTAMECCMCPFDKNELSCVECKTFSKLICEEKNDSFANMKFYDSCIRNKKDFAKEVLIYLEEFKKINNQN